MRLGPALLLFLPAACQSLSRPMNDPGSADFYGMDVGLVRTYRSRIPVCGHPHDHLMEKRVVRVLPFSGARAVLVEVRLSESLALHGFPTAMREVFAETDRGFGYFEVKKPDVPDTPDPNQIEIELPKPVGAGTRLTIKDGEATVEAIEDVTVPAGRFVGCARVRFQFKETANISWFAPGVGMVRLCSDKKGKDGRPAMEYELIRLSRP